MVIQYARSSSGQQRRVAAAICRGRDLEERADREAEELPRHRRGPCCRRTPRRGTGVGDVAGERGDRQTRAATPYGRRDMDALRPLAHPSVELDWTASAGMLAGVYRGFDEVARFYAEYFDIFEYVGYRARAVHRLTGASIASSCRTSPTNAGATESRLPREARSSLRFRVGITRICLYRDEDEALKAVGLEE